jgi:hypothetical protein
MVALEEWDGCHAGRPVSMGCDPRVAEAHFLASTIDTKYTPIYRLW